MANLLTDIDQLYSPFTSHIYDNLNLPSLLLCTNYPNYFLACFGSFSYIFFNFSISPLKLTKHLLFNAAISQTIALFSILNYSFPIKSISSIGMGFSQQTVPFSLPILIFIYLVSKIQYIYYEYSCKIFDNVTLHQD